MCTIDLTHWSAREILKSGAFCPDGDHVTTSLLTDEYAATSPSKEQHV